MTQLDLFEALDPTPAPATPVELTGPASEPEFKVVDGRRVWESGPVVVEWVRHRVAAGFVVCEPGLNARAWNVTTETTVCPVCFPISTPHTPEDDSPMCSACRHFTDKVIPLGKTGGWIGHAGDCTVHGQEVLSYATCGGHVYRSEEAREKFEGYLRRRGRL